MKTGTTELIRDKKRTKQGKRRKKALAKRGTINYYTFFPVPAQDDQKTPSRKSA